MGNYTSAYEEYYKNLNKKTMNRESEKKYFFNKSNNNNLKQVANEQISYFTKNYWIKRIERELIGSLILLLCFIGLKYTKVQNMDKFYILYKQAVVSEFNYDKSIEAFNSIEIGNFKTKDVRIGMFKFEDLKYENLKENMEHFKEYLNTLKGESIKV